MTDVRRTEPLPDARGVGRRLLSRATPLALLVPLALLALDLPAGAQGTNAVQTEPLAPLAPLPSVQDSVEPPAEPAAAPPADPVVEPAALPTAQPPAQVLPQAPAEPTALPPPAIPDDETMRAVLQGLDKTTARVSTVEAPVGGIARFGTLEIVARACHKKPPTEPPESTAFLEITDVRPDSPAVSVFSGWMFASSPALSALEHPVYDVWVIDCRKGPPAQTAGQPDETAPEAVPETEVLGEIPEDSEAAPAD